MRMPCCCGALPAVDGVDGPPLSHLERALATAIIKRSARIRERPLNAERLGLPGAPADVVARLERRGREPGARRPRCRIGPTAAPGTRPALDD